MKTSEIISVVKKHSIRKNIACPDFFEGALLGNGGLGAVVCTRPDGIAIYFGHNNIWDIRIDESHKDKTQTFSQIWKKVLDEKDSFQQAPWFTSYNQDMRKPYTQLYPRPYPASALFLFFDRKEYEVLGHELDITCGLVTVFLENTSGKEFLIQVFVDQHSDTLFCKTSDSQGNPAEIFHRMNLIPHTPDEGLPAYTVMDHGFLQILPCNGFDGHIRAGIDKYFSVSYQTNGEQISTGLKTALKKVSELSVHIQEGYVGTADQIANMTTSCFASAFRTSRLSWEKYWQCSGIRMDDDFLEHIWYTNTYFLRCALSENCKCPGLFANWMYQSIGTAWHGDYHMNYNTQQPFWGVMGANRQALHMPYLRLTEDLLPIAKSWAKDFYQLEGAYFPHSAYPVPMTVNPYPTADWGWEIFETPWTVQSLWWHYTYTQDKELLRTRIYPVMREAAVFMAAYMTREDAHCKNDGKYHLFPIIVPELYGLSNGLQKNMDGTADLALTKFLFRATLEAIQDLGLEEAEAPLAQKIRQILSAYPDYPTAKSRRGEVYLSVETEDPDSVVYNVPANLIPVFKGEEMDGQQCAEQDLEIAKNSWKYHYNEGGNDLVFYHLIGARLGILDLEKFKRHIRYCLLPNGTATDRVTLSGGRYRDDQHMDFMSRMGIWFENFSLYTVINECLIWGHTDTVKLFPNWDKSQSAAFCTLRTKGAFLVSASCSSGTVNYVTVQSECGGKFQLENPWHTAIDQNGVLYSGSPVCIPMQKGEEITLKEYAPSK